MNVIEARRVRHLIVRVDRGEELPGALLRALEELEARSAWIEGSGSLESAEIAVFDPATRTYTPTRRVEGSWEAVSLTGTMAMQGGESSLRLWVTLARESELGVQVAAGELARARAYALELRVTAFDDVSMARVPDERTGLALLVAQAGVVAAEPPRPVAGPAPEGVAAAALPQRPARPAQEAEEVYPEVGDRVTHFHFGECEVIGSDGERIRLRQERDGRVREVALTMLKIEPPSTDEATGRRHFRLARKN